MAEPADSALSDWLTEQTLLATPFDALVERFGQKLVDAGVPVDRLYAAMTLLHPQFESVSWLWMPGSGPAGEVFPHGSHRREPFLVSPIRHFVEIVFERAERAAAGDLVVALERFRLSEGQGVDRFPIMADLAAQGFTDVAVGLVPFGTEGRMRPGRRMGSFASFATRRPEGFSPRHLDLLKRLARPFGAAIKASGFEVATVGVISAYLGEDAGRRVLAGEIRRGEVRIIDAAILFADLRGFTGLADRTEPARLVEILDAHLEMMAVAVASSGGQVLKFLGDGLLATFGTAEAGLVPACRSAIDAARRIQATTGALCDRFAADALKVDIALHCGPVLYGNVGAETRLDFTVIGPAVNEASRMEQLCGTLGRSVIASDAFVQSSGDPEAFEHIADRRLRGVPRPRRLYALSGAG